MDNVKSIENNSLDVSVEEVKMESLGNGDYANASKSHGY